jgi:hypothetical protein
VKSRRPLRAWIETKLTQAVRNQSVAILLPIGETADDPAGKPGGWQGIPAIQGLRGVQFATRLVRHAVWQWLRLDRESDSRSEILADARRLPARRVVNIP